MVDESCRADTANCKRALTWIHTLPSLRIRLLSVSVKYKHKISTQINNTITKKCKVTQQHNHKKHEGFFQFGEELPMALQVYLKGTVNE